MARNLIEALNLTRKALNVIPKPLNVKREALSHVPSRH
jgi:hypothetical protein